MGESEIARLDKTLEELRRTVEKLSRESGENSTALKAIADSMKTLSRYTESQIKLSANMEEISKDVNILFEKNRIIQDKGLSVHNAQHDKLMERISVRDRIFWTAFVMAQSVTVAVIIKFITERMK